MTKKAFWHTLRIAYGYLPERIKKRFVWHAAGLLLVSLADFLGLAVLLPFLVALLHAGDVSALPFSSIFAAPTPSFFGLLLGVALLFFIAKNYFAFGMQKKQIGLLTDIIAHFSTLNAERFLQLPYPKRVDTKSSLFSEKVYFMPLQLGQGVYGPILAFFQESVVLLFIFTALLLIYPLVSIALLVLALFSGWLMSLWIKRRTLTLGVQNVSKRKKLFEEITLSLAALLDIRQSQVQEELSAKINTQIKQISQGELETNLLRIIPFRVNELIAVGGLLGLIAMGLFLPTSHDFKLLSSVFALAVFRALPAINRLQLQLVQLRLYASHLQHIEPEFSPENKVQPLSVPPLEKGIRLHNLGLRYGESPLYLFQQVNLFVPKGSIVVLSGPSGSGKSSLLRLFAGQMPVSEGEIWLDHQLLSEQTLDAWQAQIAFISQNPYLLQSHIADNISFGCSEEFDAAKAREALHLAGLDEFVAEMFTKQIGEEGFKISEGQKQRLMLARALYKQAQVFLLDEITANLDAANTALILGSLLQLKEKGKTLIFSSHNPDVFAIADIVCSFQNKQLLIHEYTTSHR